MTTSSPSLATIKHTVAIIDEPAPSVRDWMADANAFMGSKTWSQEDMEESIDYLQQCVQEINQCLRWIEANRAYIGWLRDAYQGVFAVRSRRHDE